MSLQPIEDISCRAFEQIGSESNELLRFIVGEDSAPRAMTGEEMDRELGDPFARIILSKGIFPESAEQVLSAIDEGTSGGDSLRSQLSFVLGEDSQLSVQTDEIESTNRSTRFLVARGGAAHGPELIISASHPLEGLVEVMAWDQQHQGFNFYRTLRGAGNGWVWAGNSRHALQAPTRGKGPFESHPSGNLIMKELKFPWVHWHSFKANIPPTIFDENDARRTHEWFVNKRGAETCEIEVVMPSIVRWTNARFEQLANGSKPPDTVRLIEHIVTCPTVNLASSSTESAAAKLGSPVDLPPSFVVDADGLALVGLPAPPPISVPASIYTTSLETFEFQLRNGGFSQPGDTHFAFVIPERAFEDTEVLKQAVARGVISKRLAATLLMVDFPNPVFSPKRARLLSHIPSQLGVGSDNSETIAQAIIGAAGENDGGSPEGEFAQRWSLGEDRWETSFVRELEAYYEAVETLAASQQGFNDWVRLAESRRSIFRDLPLFEFPLLFAETNLPNERLEMAADGTVVEAP